MHVFASLGELSLARGDARTASRFIDQCLETATRTTSRKYLVKGWRLRGEIAMASRAWDEAETALRQALATAEVLGNPTQLWKTHAAIGRLWTDLHKPDAAWTAFRAAREVLDRVKTGLGDPALAQHLENTPAIHELYRRSAPR
jgi:hypothetical protein